MKRSSIEKWGFLDLRFPCNLNHENFQEYLPTTQSSLMDCFACRIGIRAVPAYSNMETFLGIQIRFDRKNQFRILIGGKTNLQ
jgi:hypothetical protein